MAVLLIKGRELPVAERENKVILIASRLLDSKTHLLTFNGITGFPFLVRCLNSAAAAVEATTDLTVVSALVSIALHHV